MGRYHLSRKQVEQRRRGDMPTQVRFLFSENLPLFNLSNNSNTSKHSLQSKKKKKNFMLIDTSCCMKGVTLSRRTWYVNGKTTTAPEMFWKQHAENIFPWSHGLKSRKYKTWENRSIQTQKIQKTFQRDPCYPLQKNEFLVMPEFSEETAVHMKAFRQWLGNWPEWAQTDLRRALFCLPVIHQ